MNNANANDPYLLGHDDFVRWIPCDRNPYEAHGAEVIRQVWLDGWDDAKQVTV